MTDHFGVTRFRTAGDWTIETAVQASAARAQRTIGKSGPAGRAMSTRLPTTATSRTVGVATRRRTTRTQASAEATPAITRIAWPALLMPPGWLAHQAAQTMTRSSVAAAVRTSDVRFT